MRNTYINLTRDQNPFWGIVVEKFLKIKEVKIRPGISDKNKNFFEKFKKNHLWLINNKEYKNYENLDKLSIKGENLFNIEYNREINNSRGKKLLNKTFVDKSGKVILKTEINNVFGEMTFCEDYYKNYLLNGKFTNFSPKLLMVMKVRKEHPEHSLSQLLDIIHDEYDPKLTKSGLNHRFRKLKEIALDYAKKD